MEKTSLGGLVRETSGDALRLGARNIILGDQWIWFLILALLLISRSIDAKTGGGLLGHVQSFRQVPFVILCHLTSR
jgi:hypothetical protein